jgi:predicted MFS family arabinose efflux permease
MNHLPLIASAFLLPLAIVAALGQAGFGPAAVAYLADCSESLAADRSTLMAFYTVTLAGGGAIGALLGGAFSSWLRLDGVLLMGFLLCCVALWSLGRVVTYARAASRAATPVASA